MDNKPQLKRVTAEELLKILRDLEGQPVTRLAIYGYRLSFSEDPEEWPEAARGSHCYEINWIDLFHCQAIGWLSQLQHLLMTSVGFTGSRMRAIAENLTQLNSLDIGSNKIGNAGARAIAENLTQLTSLDIGSNQIGDAGARAIAENLTRLSFLNVCDNQVCEAGARAIAENLTQLTSLYVRDNQIGEVGARAIAASLTRLTSLNIGNNQVGEAGARAIAENLIQLTSLGVSSSQIGDAGARVIAENLTQLTSLNVSDNQIGDAGARAIAENLTQLTSLDVSGNRIGDASARAIAENLTQLTSLKLQKTAVTSLEPFAARILAGWPVISQLQYFGKGLNVYGCPLVTPSLEIVSQGPEAVRNYFREVAAQGIDRLYEAKVLILGEGGAGKTSLLRRLYQPKEGLPDEEQTTKGIDVHRHDFPGNHGKDFRLNIWDFGGQQIYHATHQFFLTHSSLYILVDDTRKDHKSVQDEGFKFWLEVVDTLSDGSPLLIFQNEKGGRSKTIDEPGIRQHFPNFKETFRGDLSDKASVDPLRKAIEYHVQKLPHVGVEVPAKWVTIRAAIEEVAKQKPYITQQEYFELYGKHLKFVREKALFLSQYFHNLGVFLHFQNDRLLKKTVILQNQWATDAVFKVLDNEDIKATQGRFTRGDCERLWAESHYADMHDELLGLMEKFELCYELPARGEWLAPQLLSPSKPGDLGRWARPSDLVLRFRYAFLPKGLISRLMVRQHRFVKQLDKCWVHGALFERVRTVVLVEESGTEIEFRARGPEAKALLSVLSHELEALNATFKGLDGKVEKLVPCICANCKQITSPVMYSYRELVERRGMGKLTIECRQPKYENVKVIEILEGIAIDRLPSWAGDPEEDCDNGLQATRKGSRIQEVPLSEHEVKQRRAAAERQVCAILAGDEFIGTGLLVGEKRILTNRHVHDRACTVDPSLKRWVAVFDYSNPSHSFDELPRVPIDVPAKLISSLPEDLDYAFLDLRETPAGDRGVLVAHQADSLQKDDSLRILSYWADGAKDQEAVVSGKTRPHPLQERLGRILSVDTHRDRFAHDAPTTPGSSGSPVFDEAFRWIGLHHEGRSGHGNHAILMSAIGTDLVRQGHSDCLRAHLENYGRQTS